MLYLNRPGGIPEPSWLDPSTVLDGLLGKSYFNLHIVIETFFAIAAPKMIAASVQQKCPKHPPMNTAYIF